MHEQNVMTTYACIYKRPRLQRAVIPLYKNRRVKDSRALYETNITFPNSSYLEKFTVMGGGGSYCSRELVSWSCFCDLFNIISY